MNRKNQWDDVLILQSAFGLDSRSEANPFYKNGKLPVFVSPMDTTVSLENFTKFLENDLNVCVPRMKDEDFFDLKKLDYEGLFYSVSLGQFEKIIKENNPPNYNVLVDVANGNMPRLHSLLKDAKQNFENNITIMAGNVGSVDAFKALQSTGVDYIRVGIGSGSSCNTAIHTGIYQHMPSLLEECRQFKKENVKIVADGGFSSYSEIIKGLAAGADYVMCGGVFNKAIESCGEKLLLTDGGEFYVNVNNDNQEFKLEHMKKGNLYVKYRGMSTREVQRTWGKQKQRHSEGKSFYNKVEYTLEEWLYGSDSLPDQYPGFVNVLKSTMSYTGDKSLEDFIETSEIEYGW